MTVSSDRGAPYRGPEPFRFVDHPIFRARDTETPAILQRVTIYRGLMIYGDQGSGKSSLLNAALTPALLSSGNVVDRVLVRPEPGQELLVDRLPLGAEGPPYLPSVLIDDDNPSARVSFSVADFLRRVRTRGSSEGPRATHVLLFDQFEEIITTFDTTAHADARKAIVSLLLELFLDRSVPTKLVLIFREDYLAKIKDLLADAPELLAQYYWLRPPLKRTAREIIDAPFDPARVAPPFERRTFTPEFVATLADEFEKQGSSDRLNLTELQIAALELWNAPDPQRLLAAVHVPGLIERHLERTLDDLAPAGLREPAVALLTFMVTPFGTRNIISEDDLISRVQSSEGTAAPTLVSALVALERTRLVRRNVHHNAAYFEIVSEALVPWVAKQRRALDRDLASRRARELLMRRFAAVLAIVAVAAIAAAIWALAESRRATKAVAKAIQESNLAESRRLEAVEALQRERLAQQQAKEASGELAETLEQQAAGTTGDQKIALNIRAQTELAVARRIDPPIQQGELKPRAYAHVLSRDQVDAARKRLSRLASEFNLPGIEVVVQGPDRTEVRYFRKEEEPGARKIAELLEIAGTPELRVRYVPGYEQSTRIRPGHYEIWFASNAFR